MKRLKREVEREVKQLRGHAARLQVQVGVAHLDAARLAA